MRANTESGRAGLYSDSWGKTRKHWENGRTPGGSPGLGSRHRRRRGQAAAERGHAGARLRGATPRTSRTRKAADEGMVSWISSKGGGH